MKMMSFADFCEYEKIALGCVSWWVGGVGCQNRITAVRSVTALEGSSEWTK